MYPRSKAGTLEYRRWLRQRECAAIVKRLEVIFADLPGLNGGAGPRILEFGCGQGHQLPILRRLGHVTASDLYRSEHLQLEPGEEFIECDIVRTPFADGSFDVIYSNHVLEHLPDLPGAFAELLRIGRPGCVYAFSLPTPLWLFLWLPTRYLDKTLQIAERLRSTRGEKSGGGAQGAEDGSPAGPGVAGASKGGLARVGGAEANGSRLARLLCPGGHGEYPRFWPAVRAFAARSWRGRFERHGFRIIEYRPLMLYATARWPLIPANEIGPRAGLAASQLFVLQRATGAVPGARLEPDHVSQLS